MELTNYIAAYLGVSAAQLARDYVNGFNFYLIYFPSTVVISGLSFLAGGYIYPMLPSFIRSIPYSVQITNTVTGSVLFWLLVNPLQKITEVLDIPVIQFFEIELFSPWKPLS